MNTPILFRDSNRLKTFEARSKLGQLRFVLTGWIDVHRFQLCAKPFSLTRRIVSLAIVTGLAHCVVIGAPVSEQAIHQLADDFFARRPSQAIAPQLTLEEGIEAQKQFVAALVPRLGPVVGYKVGLVTKEAQERLGLSSPIRGKLLEKMVLPNSAKVSARFGVRPICEADLLVVVRDEGIHAARTPLEVAQHLKELVAFIELPDMVLATNPPVNGAMLTAANVGARLGVIGQRRAFQPTPEFVEALAAMNVTITNQAGADLGRAKGNAILGQPLNAVLWLLRDLTISGEKLKPGDLLSLGSLKAVPVQAGQKMTVTYEGLPGGPLAATVEFTD
ncbi:MAG: hypothetical protein AB1813_06350 [Verrucomicrobiota bacterium]